MICLLTKGIDSGTSFTGGTANDTFTGTIEAADSTFSSLDSLNGGDGTDSLTINATAAYANPTGVTVTSIENVTINAASTVGVAAGQVDLSTIFAGATSLTVKTGTEANVKLASTTAATVENLTHAVKVEGGASQTVSLAAQGGTLTLLGTAGAINVTSSKQATNNIVIDGGSTVGVTATIAATTDAVAGGDITIGGTTKPTGAVTVVQNLTSNGGDADADDLTAANIAVTGGSSISITVNATSTAANETANGDIAIGTVAATGDGKTTTISVTQNATATTNTKAAVAVVKETSVVTFGAMKSGETLIINGLTFTASKDLTAAQAAAAFANLTAADTQSGTGITANGIYTGTFNTTVWTSAAVSGNTVTFTAQDHDETDLAFTGTSTTNDAGARIPTQVKTAGTAAVAATTSTNTVAYGAVTINDAATAALTTVTVNGYAASSTIGGTNATTKLATLNLSNAAATVDMVVADTADTLTLNAEKLGTSAGDAVVTLTAAPTTLNVKSTGNNYVNLTAAATETLAVSGTGLFKASATDLAALKTVTVTGTAGLSLNAGVSNTVTSVNTSGTTGAVTVTIDGTAATYTGGAGSDNVTLTSTTVSKAINLGAGDDKVTLASGTTSLTESIIAGNGTDTLVMDAADAETASAATTFETKIDGFEKLSLGNATNGQADTINLANMDDIAYVITGTAQKGRAVTVTGSTDNAGDTVSIVVNGVTYTTAAASYADGSALADALATAINGNDGLAASAASGVLTITTTGDRHVNVGAISATSGGGAADTAAISATATNTRGYVLNNLAAASTIELTGDSQVTAALADASGGADVINVIHTNLNGTGNTYADLIVANVETVNILVQDGDNIGPDTHSLLLEASAVTKVTIGTQDGTAVDTAGNKDLTNYTLEIKGATGVTAVDASNFIGVFTYTANDGVTTVTGGSGNDVLTASGSGDTLIGGDGKDTLKGDNLTTLTGGAGNDIFMMNTPTNVNSYSSITDLSAGDVIDLDAVNAGTVVFMKSAITLASTAVFQDYANAAVNALGADGNNAAWFQFGGNTYIVQSGNTTAGNDFVNGEDAIIQIVGLVDLSTASYNQSIGTLEIV